MSLRRKTVITIGLTLVGLVAALYAVPRNMLLRDFAAIEDRTVRGSAQRALDAITNDLASLSGTAADWGGWDDTYTFVRDRNQAFIKSNFADSTFTNLRVDLVLIVNLAGQAVYARYFDLDKAQESPFPKSLGDYLARQEQPPRVDERGVWSGLVLLPEGPVLLTSGPILTSERKGPSRGSVIFGRFLDAAEIKRLGKLTRLSLDVHQIGDKRISADVAEAARLLARPGTLPVRAVGDDLITGYAYLKDIYGVPSLILRVTVPRDVYRQGLASARMLVGTLVVVGVVFGVLILVLLERLVLSRIAFLSGKVLAIGASGDLSARIPVTGSDEVSGLMRAINNMLGSIEESERASNESQRAMATMVRNLKGKNLELESQKEQLTAQQQDLKAINEALEKATEAADAAARTKSEFLANMSHEIRTPLTSIMGYADLLYENGDLAKGPPERIQAIDAIRRNGEHLLAIINDILDLSKIEAGRMTVEHVPTSICGIVAEVASLMRVRANVKKLDFGYEYAGPVPDLVLTDPVRLRQVLINLLGNAVKFTDVGSVRLIVRYLDGPKPQVQLDVVDTGVGMTAEQATRIFEPFAQAEDSTTRRFGGTGLGLSICQRLVAMLGGGIGIVESSPGHGTRVRVMVSAVPADGSGMIADPAAATTVAEAPEPVRMGSSDGPPLAGCRILLAEDGPDNQRLISHILAKAGAEVAVVENGKLALDAALAARGRGDAFDIVLMDMQMPVMDGYTAVSQLRQKGYDGAIVALTAYAMVEDREKCLASGCDGYASKPIDRKKLIDTIQHYRQTAAGAPV